MDGNDASQRANGIQNPSPVSYSPSSNTAPTTSFASSTGPASDNHTNVPESQPATEQPKFFFNEKYAKLGVKGNFMPLAAQPVNVDLADWLAHQSETLLP